MPVDGPEDNSSTYPSLIDSLEDDSGLCIGNTLSNRRCRRRFGVGAKTAITTTKKDMLCMTKTCIKDSLEDLASHYLAMITKIKRPLWAHNGFGRIESASIPVHEIAREKRDDRVQQAEFANDYDFDASSQLDLSQARRPAVKASINKQYTPATASYSDDERTQSVNHAKQIESLQAEKTHHLGQISALRNDLAQRGRLTEGHRQASTETHKYLERICNTSEQCLAMTEKSKEQDEKVARRSVQQLASFQERHLADHSALAVRDVEAENTDLSERLNTQYAVVEAWRLRAMTTEKQVEELAEKMKVVKEKSMPTRQKNTSSRVAELMCWGFVVGGMVFAYLFLSALYWELTKLESWA